MVWPRILVLILSWASRPPKGLLKITHLQLPPQHADCDSAIQIYFHRSTLADSDNHPSLGTLDKITYKILSILPPWWKRMASCTPNPSPFPSRHTVSIPFLFSQLYLPLDVAMELISRQWDSASPTEGSWTTFHSVPPIVRAQVNPGSHVLKMAQVLPVWVPDWPIEQDSSATNWDFKWMKKKNRNLGFICSGC